MRTTSSPHCSSASHPTGQSSQRAAGQHRHNQYAGRHLGLINPAIYQIARSPHYHQAFHDITTGNNTVQFPPTTIAGYQSAPGWDPVSGWGSPNAQALIPLLARYATP